MVEENVALAYYALHRLSQEFPDLARWWDDAVQTALEALCVAAARYDPERKVAFSTFACQCIANAVRSERRKRLRRQRREHSLRAPPEWRSLPPALIAESPEERLDLIEAKQVLAREVQRLPPEIREKVEVYIQTALESGRPSGQQAADRLGVSRDRIGQAVAVLRQLLQPPESGEGQP